MFVTKRMYFPVYVCYTNVPLDAVEKASEVLLYLFDC